MFEGGARRPTHRRSSNEYRTLASVCDAGTLQQAGRKMRRILLLCWAKWFAVASRVCKLLIGKARSSLALPIKITLSIASTQMQV